MAFRNCSLRTQFEKEKGIYEEDLDQGDTCGCLAIPTTQLSPQSNKFSTREDIINAIKNILGSSNEQRSFKYIRRYGNRLKRTKFNEDSILFSSPVSFSSMKTKTVKEEEDQKFKLISSRKMCKRKREDESKAKDSEEAYHKQLSARIK